MVNKSTSFDYGHNVNNDEQDNLFHWGIASGTEAIIRHASNPPELEHCPADNRTSASEEIPEYQLLHITCGEITKMVKHITQTVHKAWPLTREILGGNKDMSIPKPTVKNNKRSSGKAPAPSSPEGGDFNPWLKVNALLKQKLLKTGERFKLQILEAREGNGEYSDVIVDVRIKGKEFAWGLSADKKAYAALYERFGSNLKKWNGTINAEMAEPFRKGYNPSIQIL